MDDKKSATNATINFFTQMLNRFPRSRRYNIREIHSYLFKWFLVLSYDYFLICARIYYGLFMYSFLLFFVELIDLLYARFVFLHNSVSVFFFLLIDTGSRTTVEWRWWKSGLFKSATR